MSHITTNLENPGHTQKMSSGFRSVVQWLLWLSAAFYLAELSPTMTHCHTRERCLCEKWPGFTKTAVFVQGTNVHC